MGRFYFHIIDGDELIPDEDGTELPDVAAATREALQSARELLADAIKVGKAKVPNAFVIVDETGLAVKMVPLAAVLPEPLKKIRRHPGS